MRNRYDQNVRSWVKKNLIFLDKLEREEFENTFDAFAKKKDENPEVKSPIDMRIMGGVWFEQLVADYYRKKFKFYEFPRRQERMSAEETKKILEDQKWEMYRHPVFYADECVTEIDFLVKNGDGFDIYEVKCLVNLTSKRVKNNLRADLCYQSWILRKAGYNVKNVYLVHMNKDYIYEKKLEPEKLIKIDDSFNEVNIRMKSLKMDLQQCHKFLKKDLDQIASFLLNSECFESKTNYCTHVVPRPEGKHLWTELYRMRRLRKAQIAYESDEKMKNLNLMHFDLSVESLAKMQLSYNQQRQIKVIKKIEKKIGNKEIVQKELANYRFPIYFYDFETTQIQIPMFPKTKPFTQIPFQYSIYVLKNENFNIQTKKNVENFNFVIDSQKDPRQEFIQKFLVDIQKFGPGSYVAYNTSFEKMVLKTIPDTMMTKKELKIRNEIVEESLDIMVFFKNFNIYLPEFQGSLSLKKTLPAFEPKFNYKNLEIQHGNEASNLYFGYVYKQISDEKWKNIAKNLRQYCNRDTWGLVILYKKILQIANGQNF